MALIPSDHAHSAQDRGNRWRDLSDNVADIPRSTTDEGGSTAEVINMRTFYWDTGSLTWVRGTQPGAGGGGGGPVTIVDGGDVAQGTTSDAAWVSGSGTVISLLKKIASAGGSAVSIADGADVAEGATTDAAVAAGAAGTVSAKLRRLTTDIGTILSTGHPITGSVAVTGPLTDAQLRASAVPVSGTFFQATQPVSLAAAVDVSDRAARLLGVAKIVDSAGTNQLSVSATGAAKVDGSAVTQPVSGTFWQATQPVSGTVTANAGTGPFPVSDNAGSLTVDAPVATPVAVRLSDGAAFISALPITDNAGSITVDGTFWQATQPVSLATNTPDVTDRAARELGRARIWDGTDEATVIPVRTQPATTEKALSTIVLPTRMPVYQVVTAEIAPAITIGVKEGLSLWYTGGTKDIYITELWATALVTTASTTGGRTTVRVSLITTAPTGGTALTAADLTGAGASAITNATAVKTGGGTLGTTFIRRGWEFATTPLGRISEQVFAASSLEDAIILRGGGSSGISIDVERVVAHTALVDQWTFQARWIEL